MCTGHSQESEGEAVEIEMVDNHHAEENGQALTSEAGDDAAHCGTDAEVRRVSEESQPSMVAGEARESEVTEHVVDQEEGNRVSEERSSVAKDEPVAPEGGHDVGRDTGPSAGDVDMEVEEEQGMGSLEASRAADVDVEVKEEVQGVGSLDASSADVAGVRGENETAKAGGSTSAVGTPPLQPDGSDGAEGVANHATSSFTTSLDVKADGQASEAGGDLSGSVATGATEPGSAMDTTGPGAGEDASDPSMDVDTPNAPAVMVQVKREVADEEGHASHAYNSEGGVGGETQAKPEAVDGERDDDITAHRQSSAGYVPVVAGVFYGVVV